MNMLRRYRRTILKFVLKLELVVIAAGVITLAYAHAGLIPSDGSPPTSIPAQHQDEPPRP